MKYSDFEKHVGARLSEGRDAVDFDRLLSSLDLAPKKRRKNWAFLWFLIPAFALGAVSAHYAVSDEHGADAAEVLDIDRDMMATDLAASSQQAYAADDKVSDRDAAGLPTLESNDKTAIAKATSVTNSVAHINNAQLQARSWTDSRSKAKPPSGKDVKIVQGETIGQSTSTASRSEINLPSSGRTQKMGQVDVADSKYNSLLNPADQTQVSWNTSTGTSISESPAQNKASNAALQSISVATLGSRWISPTSMIEREEDELFSRMKINCPSFTNAYWRIALVPEVGYFAPIKTLESKTGELSAAYENRQADERSLEGINFGLYGMVVRDRLPVYLKAGISYSRITERMDLSYEYTLQDTMVGIISSTVSANGDTITHIYGDVISETLYKGKDRQHSYIHLFDLPVSVGYTSYIGGFDIGVEGGVKINLMTRATGNLLVGSTEYSNLSLNRLFKNRIGLSYFGGVMIGRNFGRFGDFFVAPRFHYYAQDFSNDANPISQRYLSVGINAGVVYKLK